MLYKTLKSSSRVILKNSVFIKSALYQSCFQRFLAIHYFNKKYFSAQLPMVSCTIICIIFTSNLVSYTLLRDNYVVDKTALFMTFLKSRFF